MQAKLTINMDNTAFEHMAAITIATMLRELADRIEMESRQDEPKSPIQIYDVNGNKVGKFEVVD